MRMKNGSRSEKPFLLWTAAAVVISLVLSLPVFDTALSFSLGELLTDGDYQRIALGIAGVCFGLELLFLRARKWTVLRWLPVVLPVLCMLPGELFWLMGGWDQLAGVILWWFGFPMLMGAALAVLATHFPKEGKLRTGAVVLTVAVLLLAVWLWPRALGEKLILDIQGPVLLRDADGGSEWRSLDDPGAVERMLHFSEVIPAVIAPDWEERCVYLRLNGEWILAAEYGQAPYICYWTGDLADYDGSGVKWRMYHFTALYTELIAAGSRMEE